jgi:hypothetical protein
MAKKGLINRVYDFLIGEEEQPITQVEVLKKVDMPGQSRPVPLPTTRSSVPHDPPSVTGIVNGLRAEYKVVNHDFIVGVIPIIRKLMKINPDVGQAINNIVSLGNTGHKIYFDRGISPEMVDKMRNHIENKKLIWSAGCAGMDGLINKMFTQVLVGGASSGEWVPNRQLNGLETYLLVNPEDIVFVLENDNVKYSPYQRVYGSGIIKNPNGDGMVKLNPYTYRYYALNGDTEIPYGFPPYMTALERVRSQNKMLGNIDYVLDQMGLIGFLESLIGKPDQDEGETDAQYDTRLNNLLTMAQTRIAQGMSKGSVVGFKDEHEFEFNSTGKALHDALELFQNNEELLASGLKQDATLLGRAYSTTETQITVVFMKMLSELRNIQNIIKHNLQYGYAMELTLAGFKFDYLKVVFNRSTLQDDLKYQQAEEIKVRNVKEKMVMGVINQDQAADELGYEEPAFDQPMVPWEILAGGSIPSEGADGEAKKDQKNKSAKKSRAKDKPVTKK